MSRKEVIVGIIDGESEKQFRIRQMPHTQLEAWLGRALFAVGASELPDGVSLESANLSNVGMKMLSGVSFDKVKPLYDEMLTCVAIVENGNFIELSVKNADQYIDAMPTLFKLRMEAMKLNLDFFDFAALVTNLKTQATAAMAKATSNTQMSVASPES